MKQQIIIAGCGASGLLAATILASEYDVLIIEARDQCGGRIRSVQPDGFTGIIEAGPEFVHGKLPITLSLLNESGIHYHPVEGKMYTVIDGDWKKEQNVLNNWDELMRKMKDRVGDTELETFLNEEFPGKDELHHQVKRYAEGFDLADPADASMKALYNEWSKEDEVNYRIPQGYQQLMRYLENKARASGVRFLFNHRITKINGTGNNVSIDVEGGSSFHANKVILTIPYPLFTDPLYQQVAVDGMTSDYLKAFSAIGKGTVVKIVAEFSERLWKADAGFIFSNEVIPTWWSSLPDTRPLLTGWLGGPAAKKYLAGNDQQIKTDALYSLTNIFQLSKDVIANRITGIQVSNWNRERDAGMAYSYALVGSGAARETLSRPLHDKIFFCGEAYYSGENPGTVEAAFSSAKQVAGQLLSIKD